MIDLIIFFVFAAVFAGGFWCGKTFKTVSAMWQAIKEKLGGE